MLCISFYSRLADGRPRARMRLSEEPYSREDKRLLASVATQAGGALENIRLAEQMAERIENERRLAQEMEFAKQVQARLFPQKFPSLQTLEYAGGCIQALQSRWRLLRLPRAAARPFGTCAG